MSLKKVEQKQEKQICAQCRKDKALSNYYTTKDTFFFPLGKISVCKECIKKVLEDEEIDGFEAFKDTLRIINKPLYSDIFKGEYGDYIRQVQSLSQYKDTTFLDSDLFDEKKSIQSDKKIKVTTLKEEELLDLQDFFGRAKEYEERDYIYLQSEYEDYLNRYEVDSKTLENLIKEICLTQLDIRKKREKGDKVDSQQKTLQDLLGSSNLKPVQETGNQAVEAETFGTLIRKWETTRPIPEPSEEWVQNDGVAKSLRVWFTGHLLRMMGMPNRYEKEYWDEVQKYTVEMDNDELLDNHQDEQGDKNDRN